MEDKKNNKTLIITILCIIGIISIIGYTYSFFAAEVSNAVTIKGDAASLTVGLTISRVAPTEDKKLIPQLDGVIHKAVIGTKGNCLDDNHNAVCQVYKITVTNTSTVAAYINGKIELDAKDNPHLKWAEVSGLSNTTLISDIKTHEDTILTSSELYDGGEAKEYYVVVWISETGIPQTDSGSFNGTVTFENITTNTALATLTRLGITAESEILTSFATTSKLDGTTGVYATEDDLGTSYYFRGNVTNNYVKFGKYTENAYQIYDSSTKQSTYASTCTPGSNISCTKIADAGDDMYWRIVRINGDGTIRMIYDGTEAHANGTSSSDRKIGTSVFNINEKDNAFVGYMNGTVDGTNFPSGGTNSTSYAEAHANITNSTIKTMIDNWYQKYLETNYSIYLSDAIYCNDRISITNSLKNIQLEYLLKNSIGMTFQNGVTGEGYGTYGTIYSVFDRTNLDNLSLISSLKCEQVNNRFTKETTIGNIIGNGELNYPIALLTVDELVFAGGYLSLDEVYDNDVSYLYNGINSYWTMSPIYFNGVLASNFYADSGAIEICHVGCSNINVRPVISIDETAITGGTGISTAPFIVTSK